jgi:hypothetical protein
MAPHHRGMTATDADRRAQVVELRGEGLTFSAIGRELGITDVRAGQLYKKALASRVDLSVDEHRVEQSELIAEGIRELRAIANGPKAGLRYKIDSWLAIVRFLERAAKLHGTDAPTKTEILTLGGIDQQIAELELELGRKGQN